MNDQTVYVVVVRRTDTHQPLWVHETTSKKEANECHQQLTDEWAKSSLEKRPFILSSPKVTSFLPLLIYEIEVLTMTPQDYQIEKEELATGHHVKKVFAGLQAKYGN
jgi:hypothetical protein